MTDYMKDYIVINSVFVVNTPYGGYAWSYIFKKFSLRETELNDHRLYQYLIAYFFIKKTNDV